MDYDNAMKTLRWSLGSFWLVLVCAAATGVVPSAVAGGRDTQGTAVLPVSHLRVRIVTGAEELSAGSLLELRIYEAGKPVRRLALTQGEEWPRDSTRLIPLTLAEPLDPRAVQRFSLYYRAASPLSPDWDVAAAEVDTSTTGSPQRLLNATLSGSISKQGELSTEDREPGALLCASDIDCDDHRTCNGHERCAPRSADADIRGCIRGSPVACPVNQVCSEGHGCRGLDISASK